MARPLKHRAKKLAEHIKSTHPNVYRGNHAFYSDMLVLYMHAHPRVTQLGQRPKVLRVMDQYHYNPKAVQCLLEGHADDKKHPYVLTFSDTKTFSGTILNPFERVMEMFKGDMFLVGYRRKFRGKLLSGEEKYIPVFTDKIDYEVWEMFLKSNMKSRFINNVIDPYNSKEKYSEVNLAALHYFLG